MPPQLRAVDVARRALIFCGAIVVPLLLWTPPANAAGGVRLCLFCPPPTTSTTAPPTPIEIAITPTTVPTISISEEIPVIGAVRDVGGAPERLLELINAERAKVGVAALAMHEPARVLAASWARSMQAVRKLSHNDTFFTSATRRAIGATVLGENVAMDNRVDDAHDNLMQSAGHRANIVDRRFNAVGIGVVADGSGVFFIVEDFLHVDRIVTAKAPAPAPRPPTVAHPAVRRTTSAGARTSTTTTVVPAIGAAASAPDVVISPWPPSESYLDPQPAPTATLDAASASHQQVERDNALAALAAVALIAVLFALAIGPTRRRASIDQA